MRAIMPEAQASSSHPIPLPAPIAGWNARDSLAMMKPTDAIYMNNFFPSATEVEVRAGSTQQALVPAGQSIQSLFFSATQAGVTKLFAATASGVYDVTAGDATVVQYALTNGKVESVNLNISSEPWVWCCNGVDYSFLYKSSTGAFQIINDVSTPAITGIASNLISNVSLFKGRVILVEKDSLSFWYMPLASVGGAATEFDLGSIFKKGGYLVATGNWTIDGGNGPDDYFVAVTSEGEVAVYQGTNPAAANTFALIGVYYVGRPVGKRCLLQLGGDLLILAEQGLWPLSKSLLSSTINRQPALSDRIRDAFNTYFIAYGTLFGWQPVLFPKGTAILVNVPLSATVSNQFVMNTITGAWCRFTDWNAACMAVVGGELYSAVGNKVRKCWTGTTDINASIVATVKQAFSSGARRAAGLNKHIKLVQPIITSDVPINVQLALDTNFKDDRFVSSITNKSDVLPRYDTARWNQAAWQGGEVTQTSWLTVSHSPGKAFALRMRVSVNGIAARWPATNFIVGFGGLLA